jgi:hypothetical protein
MGSADRDTFDGGELAYRLWSLFEWCHTGLPSAADGEAVITQLALPRGDRPAQLGKGVVIAATPSQEAPVSPPPPGCVVSGGDDGISVVLAWPDKRASVSSGEMAVAHFSWATAGVPRVFEPEPEPETEPQTDGRRRRSLMRWLGWGQTEGIPSWE